MPYRSTSIRSTGWRAIPLACALLLTLFLSSCRSGKPVIEPDRPHLIPQVRVIDTTVHSAALGKDMPLRIVVPADARSLANTLPVVYFLHGAGTNLHDWTNHSEIASFAAEGFILVFPGAPGSYYIDDLRSPQNRYEEYLSAEIPAVLHTTVPSATRDPRETAIVGISRGGFGAVVLGLKHPELFSFIGTISGALDFAQRGFRWKAPVDSLDVQRAFGSAGSPTRVSNDPYRVLATVPKARAPFFFVSCGSSDTLLDLNKRFAAQLVQQGFAAEVHFAPGGHNWDYWSSEIPHLEAALEGHLRTPGAATSTFPPSGTP